MVVSLARKSDSCVVWFLIYFVVATSLTLLSTSPSSADEQTGGDASKSNERNRYFENSIGMKFVLIPPGEFTMGSTPKEIEEALKVAGDIGYVQERVKSEAPQHQVILTQAIYLAVNEVTQRQFKAVIGTNPSHFASTGPGKKAVADLHAQNHPVEMVSSHDACDFCVKLSEKEERKPSFFRANDTITRLDGTGYRLPTEAEWEFACRAGTMTRYWSGDQDGQLLPAGWCSTNSGNRTHAAGELKVNPFRLSDIHGNVSEWVGDSWDPTFYGKFKEEAAINPASPFFAGSQRVIRGGDWNRNPSFCRSSDRYVAPPLDRGNHVGFRVSLPVDAVRQALNGKQSSTTETTRTWTDREISEWVFEIGGNISTHTTNFTDVADLPKEDFAIFGVDLYNQREVNNDDLKRLKDLQQLTTLNLMYTGVSNAGLEYLKGLSDLNQLSLGYTQVSDAGLVHLKGFTKLEILNVHGTAVGDDGIEHLRGLTNLSHLELSRTQISDTGLQGLATLTQLSVLTLMQTQVGDEGVKHLSGLKNLRMLDLTETHVTDAGLKHLAGLTSLKTLHLLKTKVTAEGVATLKEALPNCDITHDEAEDRSQPIDLGIKEEKAVLSKNSSKVQLKSL